MVTQQSKDRWVRDPAEQSKLTQDGWRSTEGEMGEVVRDEAKDISKGLAAEDGQEMLRSLTLIP